MAACVEMMEEPPRSQICDQSRIKADLVPLSFLFSSDDNSDCSFHLSSSADEPGSSRLLPTRDSTLTQIQLITINNIASRMVDYDPMIITINDAIIFVVYSSRNLLL